MLYLLPRLLPRHQDFIAGKSKMHCNTGSTAFWKTASRTLFDPLVGFFLYQGKQYQKFSSIRKY